jgi:FlaA1/EpsC-like NDP-sugar epimerase
MLMEVLAKSQDTTKFNAVRFGNVIQSNGSVMHTFKRQIEAGEPLTVTHEEVTRFFMTVEEAAQLIVQSAALGKNGEIFVLDMGEQVKIIDLAKGLIRLIKKPTKIKIIGLRSGEKLYEELSYDPKTVDLTANDKIFIAKNEKPFDHEAFIQTIDTMLGDSLTYQTSSEEMFAKLRSLGFAIKD